MASDGVSSRLNEEVPRSKITKLSSGVCNSESTASVEAEEEGDELEPGIGNILEQKSLKWIFVGGKGGVGKTTCSCSLSVLLAKERESVLLISTDPAHNLSDAFDQKFTKYPTIVRGFDNLYAMEIDPAVVDADEIENNELGEESGLSGFAKELVSEFADSLPGIDEAKSFMQVMTLVKELKFSVVVFDTAPTGHTLRFLSMPKLFIKGLGKITQLKSQLGGLFEQILPTLGSAGIPAQLSDSLPIIQQIYDEFQDPDKATFICVCNAEFLSLFETERLVQELTKLNIDVHNIIINQLLWPEKNESGGITCKICASRFKIQSKYLEEIHDLYEDFHLTECPLLMEEVRGKKKVQVPKVTCDKQQWEKYLLFRNRCPVFSQSPRDNVLGGEFNALHSSLCEVGLPVVRQTVNPASSVKTSTAPLDWQTPPPVHVLSYLVLGGKKDAMSKEVFDDFKITYVLNVTQTCANYFEDKGITYIRIAVNETGSQKLSYRYKDIFAFIEKARKSNSIILIHCMAGVSSSVTLTIAYLMTYFGLTMQAANQLVKERRPAISPNLNFMEQLVDYEKELKNNKDRPTRDLSSYLPSEEQEKLTDIYRNASGTSASSINKH